jgi:hypothetical protein
MQLTSILSWIQVICWWPFLSGCDQKPPIPPPQIIIENPFVSTPQLFPVNSNQIDEASGIAASQRNPNVLWVIEDSFRPTSLHLLGTDGKYIKSIGIKGSINRDWEELAVSKDPKDGQVYLYIGDIGDNFGLFNEYTILRTLEPASDRTDSLTMTSFRFKYQDGRHNAEAFVVDPINGDIYLFTKTNTTCGVYRIAAPLKSDQVAVAQKIRELPHDQVTAACVNQTELLIKNYKQIWIYPRQHSESVQAAFQNPAAMVDYVQEQQGEAITFGHLSDGFYALSEKVNAPVSLQWYKRK